MVAIAAATGLDVLFYFIWSAAVTATTEVYLRGGEPKLSSVYRRALRRFFTVLLSTFVFTLGVSALTGVALVLFVLTLFGVLGTHRCADRAAGLVAESGRPQALAQVADHPDRAVRAAHLLQPALVDVRRGGRAGTPRTARRTGAEQRARQSQYISRAVDPDGE